MKTKAEKQKSVLAYIAVSVLPIVGMLAIGLVAIANNINALKNIEGRLDRLETRIDAITQEVYPNINE